MGIYTVRVREVIPTGTIPPKKNPRKRFEKMKNPGQIWNRNKSVTLSTLFYKP